MQTTLTHLLFSLRGLARLMALLLLPLLGWGQSTTTQIVISQVYGAGGGSGATYSKDYVELFNRSGTDVVVAGWTLRYGTSGSATTNTSAPLATSLIALPTNTTIQSGKYFLVRLGSNNAASTAASVPSPDATADIDIVNAGGKLQLLDNTGKLIDYVGYGTANFYNGTGPAPAPSVTNASTRKNSGCQDTGNNNADFMSQAASPRNASSASYSCVPPVIASFTPASGPVNTVVTLTGTGFAGTSAVKFNGTAAASFSVTDATTIVATVAAGTTTGTISVTTPNGIATSANAFTVTATPTTFYAKASGALNLPTSFGANTDGSGAAPVDFTAAGTSYMVAGTNRSLTANWVVSGSGSKVVLTAGASLLIPALYTYKGLLDQLANSTLVLQNTASAAYTNITQGVQDASSTIDFAQAGDYALPILPTSSGFALQNLKLTGGNKTFAQDTKAGNNGTVVPGNLTLDAAVVAGAAASPALSSVVLRGNLTLLNGASFATASSSKITLKLLASSPQTLTGNGADIILLELDVVNAGGAAVLSATGGSTNLELGNAVSGGYFLATGTTLQLNSNTLRFTSGGQATIYDGTTATNGLGTVTPTAGASINLENNGNNVTGTLRLTPGATTLNNLRFSSANDVLEIPSDLTVNGLLMLDRGSVHIGNANTLTLNGTTTRTSGTLTGSATTNLVIGGTGAMGNLAFETGFQQLNSLTLNRSASGTATLGSPLTVNGTLTLTAGLLATDATNVLTLPAAATVAGGSGSSFVSGPLVRPLGPVSSASAYIFPVGKGAAYRPLTLNITAQTNTTYYRAEQLEGRPSPSTLASPDASGTDLLRVSRARFFTLSPFATAPDAATVSTQPAGFAGSVKLTFGPDDGVNAPNDPGLVVAKRADGTGPWVNVGNAGVATTSADPLASGTITSGPINSFSDFVLGATNTIDNLNPINPLPVQLTSFTACRTASGVRVAWATASEVNSASFVVERSLDGYTFEQVARVAAQGNALVAHTYTSLDHNALAARLYYRLRQVDADGKAAYSPLVVVAATLGATAELVLTPNPAHASISLLTELPTGYTVRTALGQLVRSGTTAAGATTVPIAGLPSGVYFFELHTDAGRVVRRFVKE